MIRSCFFGLSALSKNVSLCSGVFLLGIMLCAQGTLHPYRNRHRNLQRLLVLLDLLGLYVAALYNDNVNNRYKCLLLEHSSLLYWHTLLDYFSFIVQKLKCGDTIEQLAI